MKYPKKISRDSDIHYMVNEGVKKKEKAIRDLKVKRKEKASKPDKTGGLMHGRYN